MLFRSSGAERDLYEAIARGAAGYLTKDLRPDALHRAVHAVCAGELAMSGTGVLARSVLAHGLLAGLWSSQRTFPAHDHRSQRWNEPELRTRLAQLAAVRTLLGGEVMTLRSAALRFVLSNHLVHAAVLGPRNVQQLDQLVRDYGKERVFIEKIPAQPDCAAEISAVLGETPEALLAARRLGMRPVLWTAWGRDWRADATPEGIRDEVARGRLDGGTVLLHDADHASEPGCWRPSVAALPLLAEVIAARGLTVGPLGEHGLA